MEESNNHLMADEGKVLRRIVDGWISGAEVYLGYVYYLNGNRLENPIRELPEQYEEIDEPITEDTVILSEEVDILPVAEEFMLMDEESITKNEVEDITLKRVTLADYRKLEKQVELLMKMIGGTE